MARTLGPILAIGAITITNETILHDRAMDWRVPIATGIAAGMFALAEQAWEQGAVTLAWIAFATVLLVRLDPRVPAPVESLADWWRSGAGAPPAHHVIRT